MSNEHRRIDMDEVIDDVAREMTSALMDEDEGFARRVSARIVASRAERDGRTRSLAWLLAPAAAACVLAAALFVAHENRQPAPRPIVRTQPDARTDTPAGTGPSVAVAAPRATAPAEALRTAATSSSGGSRGPAATRPASPGLEPLTLPPIVLDNVDVTPLVAAMPIEISTIAFDRIELSAMP